MSKKEQSAAERPHLSLRGLQLEVLSTADLQRPPGSAHFHPSGSLHGQGPRRRLQPERRESEARLRLKLYLITDDTG